MKLLVLSDSHGSVSRVDRILSMHKDADMVVFAGDGLRDLERFESIIRCPIYVKGNCDMFCSEDVPVIRQFYAEDKKVLLLHGHTQNVKSTLTYLESTAAANRDDIVIFGHTHEPLERTCALDNGGYRYFFNPGSVREGSFGIILVKKGSVLMSHGCL